MLTTHHLLVPRLRKRGAIPCVLPKGVVAYSGVMMMMMMLISFVLGLHLRIRIFLIQNNCLVVT
jgi:hypothetical protein